MFAASGRRVCWYFSTSCLTLAAGGLLLLPAAAQNPKDREYLDQVRRANEIKAQKLEADVRAAVSEAAKLATTNPVAAAERLRKVLDDVEADTVLTRTRRDVLKRMLQDRIRLAELDAGKAAEKKGDPKLVIRGPRQEKRLAAEMEDIIRTLSQIRGLQKAGQTADAARMAAELARRYPSNPAAQAGNTAAGVASTVITDRQNAIDQSQRVAGIFRDVDKSASPIKGDIEFDKDFQKRTADRKMTVKLTDKEKAIMKALASPLPALNFDNTKFEDVMKYLADFTDQPLVIDPAALREAALGYDSPITFKVPKGVAVRTVLRRILGEFGLTYVVKDEAIQIVSTARAKEMMVTRTYYLGDLLDGGVSFGARVALIYPGIQQAQMMQNAAALVELIKNSVDPETWRENGGNGTITFFPPTRAIVIRQTAEVHAMIGSSFR